MVNCPKCRTNYCVKDGIVKGRQRYQCKTCRYRHTVQHRGASPVIKRQALELYLEGLGFRSIGRFLKCSHVAVYNWIKSYGAAVQELRSDLDVEVVEMDELHTYIGSKKTTVGFGLLLIEMESSSSTAYWAPVAQKREESYGKPSRKTRFNK